MSIFTPSRGLATALLFVVGLLALAAGLGCLVHAALGVVVVLVTTTVTDRPASMSPRLQLSALLTIVQLPCGLAVAVDGEVVPRGVWDEVELQDGQRVEIVQAVQGG